MEGGEQPVLKIINLWKSFKRKPILEAINIEVMKGETVGIVSATGEGKSTLLELIIGFHNVDRGEILISTQNEKKTTTFLKVDKNNLAARKIFGISCQENAFYENLTVEENLEYFGLLYDLPKEMIEKRTEFVLRLAHLTEHAEEKASHLTRGMQKRLDIALSLIHNPQMLLLDEPTFSLDVANRKIIYRMIRSLQKMGMTILICSNHTEDLEKLCERIAILHKNRICHIGRPKELIGDDFRYEVIELVSKPGDYRNICRYINKEKFGVKSMMLSDNALIIVSEKGQMLMQQFINVTKKEKEEIMMLEIRKPTLSDIYTRKILGK